MPYVKSHINGHDYSYHDFYKDFVPLLVFRDTHKNLMPIRDMKVNFANDFVSKLVVSKKFVDKYPLNGETKKIFGNKKYEMYKTLIEKGEITYDTHDFGYWLDINHIPGTIQEHVIPSNLYINEEVLQKVKEDEEYFNSLKDAIVVCIVLKEEDKMLTDAGCKEDFPKDLDGNTIDIIKHPFARYDKSFTGMPESIEIYGHRLVDGRIYKNID